MAKNSKKQPNVCIAARTVGVSKPIFDPNRRDFSPPQLTVLGTGFWIKNKNVFVTCAHVVQGILGGQIEISGMLVVGGNGNEYKKAVVFCIDFQHDLAVLAIEADLEFITSQNKNGLDLNEEKIEVGEKVGYAGFPFGMSLLNEKHSPTYAEGVVGQEMIDHQGPKFVQISGPVIGGYSGSPVVLKESGKVIGMVSNSPSIEAGNANIFKAVHWIHIKELVRLIES